MIWKFLANHYAAQIQIRLAKAIARQDFKTTATCFNRAAGVRDVFQVGMLSETAGPEDPIEIEFADDGILLRLVHHKDIDGAYVLAHRLPSFARLFGQCWLGGARGIVRLSLGDKNYVPSLAFCSNLPGSVLIPDFEFMQSYGYRDFGRFLQRHAPAWRDRNPIAVWRGVTTGVAPKGDWLSLPRVKLCEIAAQHPEFYDAGLTSVVQVDDAKAVEDALRDAGLMRPFMDRKKLCDYKYQIDIDGNSNAWSGLFTKLMTGSPVLKVESPWQFRQWYYDQLQPFVNYVPVRSDLSDLMEKLSWLHSNDDKAQAIGAAGRALALSLSYDTEMEKACDAIIAAARR